MTASLHYLGCTYTHVEKSLVVQAGYERSNKITSVFRHREIYRGFMVP